MSALRKKSLALTQYLEELLVKRSTSHNNGKALYEIITPADPAQRGAQLSIRLRPGMLSNVMKVLEEKGVVVDERQPDVVRVAPAPLYNTFQDVWDFVSIFTDACLQAVQSEGTKGTCCIDFKGAEEKGWSQIK